MLGVVVEVVALAPGQLLGEAGKQVEHGVGHDDDILEVDQGWDADHTVAHAPEAGGHPGVDLGGAEAGILAQNHLQEEHGQSDQEQHEQVGNEEGSAALNK